MKATLWSHLDCQGGLPQNTLARSTFKNLDCQGGQPEEYLGQEQGYVEYVPEILLSFSQLPPLGFLSIYLCTNISICPLFVQISLRGMFHYPQKQSNEMVLSRLPSWRIVCTYFYILCLDFSTTKPFYA